MTISSPLAGIYLRARRFYARFLYKEGLDLEEIRLLMRHEKIDTTKDYIR